MKNVVEHEPFVTVSSRCDGRPPSSVFRRSAVVALACTVVFLFGCAKIESFQAQPRNVCLGNTVTVSWAAVGDVVLSSDPVLPQAGPKASTGSEQFTPSRTTRFTLQVHRLFSSTTAEADVDVVPRAKEFGGVATCSLADHAITLSVPLTEPQVSSALKVASVTNMNQRPIVLAKGNVQITLPAGSSSTEINGQLAAGTWTLRAPLVGNENCDDALRSVAERLIIQIAFSCGE